MLPKLCCKCMRQSAKCRVCVAVFLMTISGSFYAAHAAMNLLNPEFVSEMFCQQNNFEKDRMGKEDKIIDESNNTCNSNIVLGYEPEGLGPYLQGLLVLGAIVGSAVAMAGLLAAAGLLWNRRPLLVPWLAANGVWIGSLLITAAILTRFGFTAFVSLLVGVMLTSTLFLVDAILFYRNIPRQSPSYKLNDIPMQDSKEEAGEGEEACDDVAGRPYVTSAAV